MSTVIGKGFTDGSSGLAIFISDMDNEDVSWISVDPKNGKLDWGLNSIDNWEYDFRRAESGPHKMFKFLNHTFLLVRYSNSIRVFDALNTLPTESRKGITSYLEKILNNLDGVKESNYIDPYRSPNMMSRIILEIISDGKLGNTEKTMEQLIKIDPETGKQFISNCVDALKERI
ncbi:hypothetical protein [Proteus mirabilis]|uniref:hypothetical protein n=1 Tax=Proteus mirabilis TaxID=584 RepID=UPI0034D4D2A8